MIEALWVMTYFKISLPTRNWDIAFHIEQERVAYVDPGARDGATEPW